MIYGYIVQNVELIGRDLAFKITLILVLINVETIHLPSLAFKYTVLATIFSNSISSSVVNPKKLGSQWTPTHTSKQKVNEGKRFHTKRTTVR